MSLASIAVPFVKASACGNDFLLIDARELDPVLIPQLPSISRRMCNRHDGIGADGVEWIYPHASADAEIRLMNADGSTAEISGNGTRCVAALIAAERRKEKIAIQTGAGLKVCTLISKNENAHEFEAEMGKAVVGAELRLPLADGETRGIPVSMGNPHYVVFGNDFPANWRERAAAIQRSPKFPEGVNVEFVTSLGQHDIQVRFFERGAGETQSSGTGSCAAAVASVADSGGASLIRVHSPGGVQTVRLEDDTVFLRGWARLVCHGEFYLS